MLFGFRKVFFTVSHNRKPLPWAFLYKHNKTARQGEFHKRHRELLLSWWLLQVARWAQAGSRAAPWLRLHRSIKPWRNQPLPCSYATLWVMHKPLRAVNLSHKLLRSTGAGRVVCAAHGVGGSWEVAWVCLLLWVCSCSWRAREVRRQKAEEVVESFRQGWCFILDRALVGLYLKPLQAPKQQFRLNSGCRHQVLFLCPPAAANPKTYLDVSL